MREIASFVASGGEVAYTTCSTSGIGTRSVQRNGSVTGGRGVAVGNASGDGAIVSSGLAVVWGLGARVATAAGAVHAAATSAATPTIRAVLILVMLEAESSIFGEGARHESAGSPARRPVRSRAPVLNPDGEGIETCSVWRSRPHWNRPVFGGIRVEGIEDFLALVAASSA